MDWLVNLPSETVVWICSGKNGVLGNFGKFTGKHLCQRLTGKDLVPEILKLKACNFI